MGQFKPGESGNPGGRPKTPAAVREAFHNAAAEHAMDALHVIVGLMNNKRASHSIRLKAANLIVNRAVGKAIAFQAIAIVGNSEYDELTMIERARGLGFVLTELQRDSENKPAQESVVSEHITSKWRRGATQ